MKVAVIKIGNSKGIRLAKPILDHYGIGEELELIMEEDCLVLRPVPAARVGWEDAFRRMHEEGEDELLIDDLFEDEDMDNL